MAEFSFSFTEMGFTVFGHHITQIHRTTAHTCQGLAAAPFTMVNA